MAVIVSNRELIPAPPPGTRRYGLFDAVASSGQLTGRGIGAGIQFLVDHCGNETEEYEQVCGETSPVKTAVEGSDVIGTLPFWLVNRKRCGAVGRTGEEMQRAVRQALATGAQTRAEDILWDGNGLAGVANLTNAAGTTTVTPAAPGAGAAIAALEAAFYAENGYVGTIHVNTAAYAAARYAGLVDRQGGAGTLRTPLGSVWSFGAGYGVTGPANVAPDPDSVWAFMTAPVHLWRSGVLPQPDPRQVLDRTLNQWDVVAEEVFAITWECPEIFAVQIPLAAPGVVAVA